MVLETDEMHEKVEAGHDTNPDHIETVCVEIINDDEDSFASADETVPDIPSPSTSVANGLQLTRIMPSPTASVTRIRLS